MGGLRLGTPGLASETWEFRLTACPELAEWAQSSLKP
jgi:hypothetical protein